MFIHLFLFCLIGVSVRAQEKTGVVYINNLASDGYKSLTAKYTLAENGSNVDVTLESANVNQTAGKYELCVHPYGGYDRSNEIGSPTTCFGIMDSSLNLPSNVISGASITDNDSASLIGEAMCLEKRTIALEVYLAPSGYPGGANFEVQLQDSSSNVIQTTGVLPYSTTGTKLFDFPSNPSGSYKLVVTTNTGSSRSGTDTSGSNTDYDLIFAEYTRGDKYWKSYMLTSHVKSDTGTTSDDFPGISANYITYVSGGWEFSDPTLYKPLPELTVQREVLTIAAVGTIGRKFSSTTQTAGGYATTDKILCGFDDVWDGNNRTIYGQALLSYEAANNQFRFQTDIGGLACSAMGETSCEHSFHFHEYGDIADGNGFASESPTTLGPITTTFSLGAITLSGAGTIVQENKNVTATADQFRSLIGKALTVHDGPLSSSATVVWGVCGVAPADACMRYGCPDVEYEDPIPDHSSRSASASTWLLVLVSVLPLLKVFNL